MRKVKWVFFGYLALLVLTTVIGMAVAFNAAPDRVTPTRTTWPTYGGAIKTLDPAEVERHGRVERAQLSYRVRGALQLQVRADQSVRPRTRSWPSAMPDAERRTG